MKYLEKRNESGALRRASLENAVPWARSVIVCALNYNADYPYSTEAQDHGHGWISRYAWGGKDYHDSLLKRLEQVETAVQEFSARQGIHPLTRCYVDTRAYCRTCVRQVCRAGVDR